MQKLSRIPLIFLAIAACIGWHEVIGEQTIAEAILDRIVHDAQRLELKGIDA